MKQRVARALEFLTKTERLNLSSERGSFDRPDYKLKIHGPFFIFQIYDKIKLSQNLKLKTQIHILNLKSELKDLTFEL